MKIGITTFGADGGRSGIGQYVIHIVKELSRVGAGHEFDVMVRADEEPIFLAGVPDMGRRHFRHWPKHPILDILSHQLGLAYQSYRSSHDVLFLPAGNRRIPLWAPCPTVGAVHDLSSFHVDTKYDAGRMLYIKHVLPIMIRRLSRVITISENSKRDIVRFTGIPEERVVVTHLAHDAERFAPRDPAGSRRVLEERLGVRGPYVLYTARLEHPGKNHVRLIRAFARLKQHGDFRHTLVLAGADWNGADAIHAAAAETPCAGEIVFPGFVPGDLLPHLYAGADLFMFPSLYEGFGIPVLEAMATGVPVACADTSSMPEVGGLAALYFDPTDEAAIEQAMRRVLESAMLRQQMILEGLCWARTFSWETAARRTLETLLEARAVPLLREAPRSRRNCIRPPTTNPADPRGS
jgi:glycosyltransferase involved in cell wall biosynthesis